MIFPGYAAYKSSGIEWTPSIPASWTTARLKHLFALVNREPLDGDGIVTAFRDGTVTLRTNRRIDGFTNALQEHGYQRVLKGDLVIHAMDAFAGAVGVSDSDGKATPVYSVCVPRTQEVISSYYGYLIRHVALSGYISSLSKGIRERSTEFRWREAGNVIVPVPSPAEQRAIVSFISNNTAAVDQLISKQQRLIELLQEKRRAFVSQAVTRGLNAHAPMKTSGIAWLGDVPTHWDLRPLKRLSTFRTSGPRGWSERIASTGHIFVQSGDLTDTMDVDFSSAKRVLPSDDAESTRTRLRSGDVVVCITGAKTGNAAVCRAVPEPAYVNQHLCLVRPSAAIDSTFLAMVLKSEVGQTHFALSQYGLKQGLSLEDVETAPIPLPPKLEQERIVSFVKKGVEEFNVLRDAAQRTIELLQERRAVLTSAAVTGQIDVRQVGELEPA